MKIYPILNNLGKGKYVFIFILNERAVTIHRRRQWFLAGNISVRSDL